MSPSELIYREHAPPARLAPYVRCLWTLRAPAGVPPAQPVVPDGCVELVFHRGDPFRQYTGTGSHLQPRALIVGAITSPVVIAPTGRADVIGVRLHPWSAAAFLGLPVGELRGAVESFDEVLPALAIELRQRLDGASDAELLAGITRVLERRVDRLEPPDPALREVVARVGAPSSSPSVSQLAAAMGRSTRWVQRSFSATVGITPKMLARIARLQRVLRLATSRRGVRWSTIAADAGYFDHSHLIRDFRRFVGCTPSQFDPALMPITDVFVER